MQHSSIDLAVMTPATQCTTGETRLQVATESIASATSEGLLELCINTAWGTICDSLFDDTDASVACSLMNGFSSQGEQVLVYDVG